MNQLDVRSSVAKEDAIREESVDFEVVLFPNFDFGGDQFQGVVVSLDDGVFVMGASIQYMSKCFHLAGASAALRIEG